MKKLIGTAYDDPPFHYGGGLAMNVVFRTDRDVIEQVLPPVLKGLSSRNLAVVRVSSPLRSHMGSYTSSYIFLPALFGDQPVQHMVTGMKTTFSGVVGGREVWGMPLQMGEVAMGWEGDVLSVVARRSSIEFMRLVVRLEQTVEAPESRGASMTTYEVQRRPWETSPTRNALVAITGQPPEAVADGSSQRWRGSAVLKFPGGVPGDDWSIFPVHEVISVDYTINEGRSSLDRGAVIAEW